VPAFLKNPKTILIIALVCIFIILIYIPGFKDVLNNIEMLTYDWRARLATDSGLLNSKFSKADDHIMILTADNYTFDKLSKYDEVNIGRWPWSRRIWGDVVNFIQQGKPKAIVFDIKFEGIESNDKVGAESDKYFSDAIKNHKNIIFGLALSNPKEAYSQDISKLLDKKLTHSQIDRLIYHQILREKSSYIHPNIGIDVDDSALDKVSENDNFKNNFLNNITFYKHSAIPEYFLDYISGTGIINVDADEETHVRYNVPLYKISKGKNYKYVPSLPLAAMLQALPDSEKKSIKIEKNKVIIGKRVIPVDDHGKVLISWHGEGRTYPYVSLGDVIITDALNKGIIKNKEQASKEINYVPPSVFKDKIVIIGITAAGTDILPTPMSLTYPGPEIIATALDNYLNDADTSNVHRRKFITKAPFILNLVILITFCTLVGITNIRMQTHYLSIVVLMFLIFLFFYLAIGLFIHPFVRIWINMTYPLVFMIFTAIATYLYRVIKASMDRKAIEGLFGKFVSPQVLDKLLADPKSIVKGNQRKIMTVLFSDIRNFTTLSESIPANDLIPQINEYFTEVVEIILKNDGTLDKFMGDAVMAFWNDPLPVEDHPYKAVKTAIEMLMKVDELNHKWKQEGKITLNIGVGINSGEMLVGYMGSRQIVDYTVVGDNVNLASRLESLNKEYKSSIIISELTYLECKDKIQAEYLDEVKVKGKNIAVKIYKVTGLNSSVENRELQATNL